MITFTHLGKFGRLGNQLFQIASTIGTAIQLNDSYAFPAWPYEDQFNLHSCFSALPPNHIYTEPFFHYSPINLSPHGTMIDLRGYFQSYKYWNHCDQLVRSLLTPVISSILPELNGCSLHIRRGDYVGLESYHPFPGLDYYREAMEMCPAEKYYVFSDDISWCKTQFKGNEFEFIEGNTEVKDLALMSKCNQGNIIANSSFSWWGAWLNNTPSKVVIAPKKWFGSKISHETKDLIPPQWIRI